MVLDACRAIAGLCKGTTRIRKMCFLHQWSFRRSCQPLEALLEA